MSLVLHRYPDLSGQLFHTGYSPTAVLRFSPAKWQYFLEGPDGELKPLRGVTRVLKIVDKSAALIGWSTRLFLEKAISLAQDFRRGDRWIEADWTDFISMLAYAKDEHKRVLDAASDTGHTAHAFVESLVRATMAEDESRRLEVLAKFPEDARAANSAVAAICFFADHNVRYISAEQRVFSREWMVAGTMDGEILCDSCQRDECPCQEYAPFINKRLCLDMKTSNGIQGTYFAQVALYRKARTEEFPNLPSFDGSVILRMGKDDRAEFEPHFIMTEESQARHLAFFKRCLDLTESVEAVDAEMQAVKDARREKVKQAKAEEMKIRCPKADEYKGSRKSKCLPDGSQCEACQKIYEEKQEEKNAIN